MRSSRSFDRSKCIPHHDSHIQLTEKVAAKLVKISVPNTRTDQPRVPNAWPPRAKWWLVWAGCVLVTYGLCFASVIGYPLFLPLEGRWAVDPVDASITMGWFGQTGVSFGLGSAIAALFWPVRHRLPGGAKMVAAILGLVVVLVSCVVFVLIIADIVS